MSKLSKTFADDSFRARASDRSRADDGVALDASYQDGPALGYRPSAAGNRTLGIRRRISGAVLDVGCGTGENALPIASLGLPVLGIDVAETALAIAREKAADQGAKVEFAAADAFQLKHLGSMFRTVLDCGLFHTVEGEARTLYVASLASATEQDGILYLLCFSDSGPDTGQHSIRQEELGDAFNPRRGWNVVAIKPDRIQTRYHDDGAPAWLATIKRISLSTLAPEATNESHVIG